ncbi:10047_t:CDS:2 [Funneliformis caledonium]|uniref:Transcription initiation factor IIE subunit beta n=2 Tax=Funneliformis TaxID=1117308 RepID=A0A9N9AI43_9GLOM|nr:3108_t:CDS:2 [Funneliformis mosseae]CAG8533899.1 10047_t:CDS:2 [Funneliformis caledonium]
MSDLSSESIANFKKHLASQPIYVSPKITNNASSSNSQGSTPRSNADPLPISKKKKPKPVYSQPSDTGVVKHTLSQLHKDRMDVPQSAEDLKANKIADIISNKELYNLMIKNEKIKYNSVDCTFQYKPDYAIRTKEDLLNLLKERQEKAGGSCGMPFRELDDCIDLSNAIQELESEGKIMVIRLMKDASPRLLYYNDLTYNTPMDKEFVDMFHNVKVPDESDLKKSLEDAGLQTMAVLENKSRAEDRPKQRKRKQAHRKIKITNTHLENFIMPTKS